MILTGKGLAAVGVFSGRFIAIYTQALKGTVSVGAVLTAG